jgi:hypothetical protein
MKVEIEVKEKKMEVKRRGKRGKKMSRTSCEEDLLGGPIIEWRWGKNRCFGVRKEDRVRGP